MAVLQHLRSRTVTICSRFQQLSLVPKQLFSLSSNLEGRQRKRAAKVDSRFARIEPGRTGYKMHPSWSPPSLEQLVSNDSETSSCGALKFDSNLVDSLLHEVKNDLPLSNMPDPFVKDYPRCYLCTNNVKLDYKNVRLLSQFVSPYTGRIYGRAITGLCIPMQKQIAFLIKRARVTGYMPFMNKDPQYLHDPQPFNPMSKKN